MPKVKNLKRTINQVENKHQEAIVAWFKLQYPHELLFCIPNQLIRTNLQAILMARRGVVAGIPDMCVAAMRKPYGSLYIELKSPTLKLTKTGGVAENQSYILGLLNSLGYKAEVCYGVDEAIKTIKAYMELGNAEWQ